MIRVLPRKKLNFSTLTEETVRKKCRWNVFEESVESEALYHGNKTYEENQVGTLLKEKPYRRQKKETKICCLLTDDNKFKLFSGGILVDWRLINGFGHWAILIKQSFHLQHWNNCREPSLRAFRDVVPKNWRKKGF